MSLPLIPAPSGPARFARALVAAALLAGLAPAAVWAQGLVPVPSNTPSGPASKIFETYFGTPFVLEFNHPGLTHAQSLPLAATKLTYFAFAASSLPGPIPLSPTLPLWLDPSTSVVFPVPNTLKVPGVLALPSSPSVDTLTLPMQVITVDLLDPLFTVYGSDLHRMLFRRPPIVYDDIMLPLGSTVPGSTSTTFDAVGNRYLFRHQTGPDVTEYEIPLNLTAVQRGVIEIRETQSGYWPVRQGGFTYKQGGNPTVLGPSVFQNLGTHTLTGHGITGGTVWMEFQDVMPVTGGGNVTLRRRHEYTLVGRSLQVHARSLQAVETVENTYAGFVLGIVQTPSGTSRQPIRIPYMDQIGVTLLNNQLFVSTFIDLFRSSAQTHSPASFNPINGTNFQYTEIMAKEALSDGTTVPINETGWVTLSSTVRDCFVDSSAGRSPQADAFKDLIGIAFSGEATTTDAYARDRANVERLVGWGFQDVLAWKVHWMNFGQNRRATTHVPANPNGGTDSQFFFAIRSMVINGWRAALYTDFFSLDQAQGFDNNPQYSETPGNEKNFGDGVKLANNAYRLGFGIAIDLLNQSAGLYNTRLLSPKRSILHFEREGEEMVSRYLVNANYFDVMTIAPPDLVNTAGNQNKGVISQDARSVNDRTVGEAINSYKNLFRRASEIVDGPVVSEGSFFDPKLRFDTYYMGYVDGIWRTLATGGPPVDPQFAGSNAAIIPDFEINVVRPKMPGLFGMGQYTRFFPQDPIGVGFPISDEAVDELRATQMSYGHNGYLMTVSADQNGLDFLTWAQQIKEYYTMRGLHDEMNAATGAVVSYRAGAFGSPWGNLDTKLKQGGFDFTKPVIRTQWDNGLLMIMNNSSDLIIELGFIIPPNGWFILNPFTGYVNVNIWHPFTYTPVQFTQTVDYVMADGGGIDNFFPIIGFTSNLRVQRFDTGLSLTEELNGNITVQ